MICLHISHIACLHTTSFIDTLESYSEIHFVDHITDHIWSICSLETLVDYSRILYATVTLILLHRKLIYRDYLYLGGSY